MVTVLVALSAAGVGPAAAESDTGVETVLGTVEYLTVDGPGDHDGAPVGTGMPLVPVLQVDGDMFPLDGDLIPEVTAGSPVSITVAAPEAVEPAEALEMLADSGSAVVGDVALRSVELVETSGPGTLAAGLTAGPTLGAHTMTILPVAWAGHPADGTTAATLQALGASTGQYWSEQTGGRLTFASIDVRPVATIPVVPDCSRSSISTLLSHARAANGVGQPSATQHVVVYFADLAMCPWDGMASIGSGGGVVWLNGSLVADVLAHEVGHNLGLGHANTITCSSGGVLVPLTVAGAGCTTQEYADRADVMGYGMSGAASGTLNVGLADALGLASVADTASLDQGTTVTLAPVSQVTALRGTRTALSDGTQLYAEYRPAAGRDVRRREWAGVQVRIVAEDVSGTPSSYLVDLGPAPSFSRTALALGTSFAVPGSAVALQTVAIAPGSAQVRVLGQNLADQRYVQRVYRDLMGRDVDPSGLATWTYALATGTPRVAVAQSITSSDEYRMRLITASYLAYLNRGPDPTGLANWLQAMRSGITIQYMEAGFLGSPESYLRAGATDDAWVAQLYGQVLGRSPGTDEVAHWTTVLRAGVSRGDVAMGFTLSTEHLTALVDGTYRALLGRGIDPAGAATWVGAIQGGSRYEDVIGAIIASQEYYQAS